jgi:hypothetical protein
LEIRGGGFVREDRKSKSENRRGGLSRSSFQLRSTSWLSLQKSSCFCRSPSSNSPARTRCNP